MNDSNNVNISDNMNKFQNSHNVNKPNNMDNSDTMHKSNNHIIGANNLMINVQGSWFGIIVWLMYKEFGAKKLHWIII